MSLPLQHLFLDALPELTREATAAPCTPGALVLNTALAADHGWDADWLASDEGLAVLAGQQVADSQKPVAQVYAGHQFGGFSPSLGDGRALLLGEVDTPLGLRDVHLKGSGRTPLSRGGDGLAAVGPMLREYVVSESLHALGIPTTRALAVLDTGGRVVREDGVHPGAVLVRTAASHLRVGTFQYARATGDEALLQRVLDFSVARHVPEAAGAANPALSFFAHVVRVQAHLVARWMLVGFVHGVMNTDNMALSGESIDFGPCAFMDAYDPGTVFSSIDERGRYAYGNQPPIAQWNLARLAECLIPLVDEDEDRAIADLMQVLDGYAAAFNDTWLAGMAAKLGLPGHADGGEGTERLTALVGGLLALLTEARSDWTGFWVDLSAAAATGDLTVVRDRFVDREGFDAWAAGWLALAPDAAGMERTNPVRIPRNHLVDEALRAAENGDLAPLHALVAALQEPFGQRPDRPGWDRYADPAPDAFTQGFRTFCGT